MGSWYKTCGLSNLHITDGEEVMVFVLEPNTDKTDRCYNTAFWKPLLLPFYSKYADYGRGDGDSGIALPYIMEAIKKDLVECDVGENQYHDIAVKKDNFDVELFYEAVHEKRLEVKSRFANEGTLVDYVMFRKDIVDDILENFKREIYVGDGKGTTGYNNNYSIVGFQDIVNDLPEYLLEFANLATADEDGMGNFRFHSMEGLGGVFDYGHPNRVNAWCRGDHYRFCRILRIKDVVGKLVLDGKMAEATKLMIDHLKAVYISVFIDATRRVWMPGAHEGSQANEAHGYRIMAEATMRALKRERDKYAEDIGEEEVSEF